MKYSNIKKLAVVGLTIIGSLTQSGCGLIVGECVQSQGTFQQTIVNDSHFADPIKINGSYSEFCDEGSIVRYAGAHFESGSYVTGFDFLDLGVTFDDPEIAKNLNNYNPDSHYTIKVTCDDVNSSDSFRGKDIHCSTILENNTNNSEVQFDFTLKNGE